MYDRACMIGFGYPIYYGNLFLGTSCAFCNEMIINKEISTDDSSVRVASA